MFVISECTSYIQVFRRTGPFGRHVFYKTRFAMPYRTWHKWIHMGYRPATTPLDTRIPSSKNPSKNILVAKLSFSPRVKPSMSNLHFNSKHCPSQVSRRKQRLNFCCAANFKSPRKLPWPNFVLGFKCLF